MDGSRVKVDGGQVEQLQDLNERMDGWPNEGESDREGLESRKKEKQEIVI